MWSDRKRLEKLRYLHRNPVRRGLVEKPEDWKWSSFQHHGEQKVWWRLSHSGQRASAKI